MQYGRHFTPELEQELARLGTEFGYSQGHFHVAFYIASSQADRKQKTRLRESIRFLIEHPEMDQERLDVWLTQIMPREEAPDRYRSFVLKRLVAENFGPYPSLEIDFAADHGKPITLIGGTNGGGKTSLLKALSSAFYGIDQSQFVERSPLYNEGRNGTTLRLQLTLEDGDNQEWSLERTYEYRQGSRRPTLHGDGIARLRRGTKVLQGDELAEELELFLPQQLSDYFFFDADKKIEQFLQDQQGALKRGIERILGIELLNDLDQQIGRMRDDISRERKKVVQGMGSTKQSEIQTRILLLEEKERDLRKKREDFDRKIRDAEGEVQASKEAITALLQEYDPERQKQYEECLGELGAAEAKLQETLTAIDKLSQQWLPLMLLQGELGQVLQAARLASESRRDTAVPEVVQRLYQKGQRIFGRYDYDTRHLDDIFSEYREQLREGTGHAGEGPELTQTQLRNLEQLLLQIREGQKLSEALAAKQLIEDEIAKLKSRKNRLIPPKDDLKKRYDKEQAGRDKVEAELRRLREEAGKLDGEIEGIQKEATGLRKQAESAGNYGEELKKLDEQLERVERFQHFMQQSGQAFRGSKIADLEREATAAYQNLTNKPDLKRSIQIDSESFAASLHEALGEKSIPELSSGEQQILAMALIAGLAASSGKSVPMVIDTPFGRLDKEHRDNLCTKFLPTVAQQVVVLSTNEEIIGEKLTLIRPFVGREYLIDRKAEGEEHSFLREGYF